MGGIIVKRFLCILCCLFLTASCTACHTAPTEPDRSQRVVRLSSSSKPAPETTDTTEEESSEAFITPEDFVRIPRAEQIPDYMQNNPALYADLLENILKLYYAGLLSGSINADTFSPCYAADQLPSPQATAEERWQTAAYCTVGGALEYFGCDLKDRMKYLTMYNGTLPYFCYDREAAIYPAASAPEHTLTMNSFSQTLYFIFRYANNDKVERDALTYAVGDIDTYVKNYYQGILNGTITNRRSLSHTADILPAPNASLQEREHCAGNATISGALDYAGFYTVYTPYISSLGFNHKTASFTLPDYTSPDILAISSPDAPLSNFFG